MTPAPRAEGGSGSDAVQGVERSGRLLLGAGLLAETLSAAAASSQQPIAIPLHFLACGCVTLAVARRSAAVDGGQAPALLTALAATFLPPLGVAVSLFAWREARAVDDASGELLEELYEELHEGTQRPEPTQAPDHEAAVLDAVDLEPYVDALRYGDLELRRGAIERLQRSGGPERIKVLRRALRDRDDEVRALALAALSRIEVELNEGVVAAARDVRADPQSVEAHARLGDQLAEFCYLEVADPAHRAHYHGLAFRAYSRAIELSHEGARDAELLVSLGKMLLHLGYAKSASEAFQLASEAAPRDPRPLLWLAEAHFTLGQLDAVEEACARALELQPGPVVRAAAAFWTGGEVEEEGPAAAEPRGRRRLASDEGEGPLGRDITPEEVQHVLAEVGQLPGHRAPQGSPAEVLPGLIDALELDDPAARREAHEELMRWQSDEAVREAIRLCRERSPGVRRVLARYLGRTGSVLALRTLVGLLDDPEPGVREEARLALGARPTLGAAQVELLLESLASPSPQVRIYAAQALGASGLERAALPLVHRLEDEDPGVRQAVIEGLRRLGDARALRALTRRLADPVEAVRYRAAEALGTLEPPGFGAGGAPGALAEVARADASPRVRLMSLWSLAQLAPRRALAPLLVALSEDPEPRVRIEACRRLGKLGRSRAVLPLLRVYASDQDHAVRLAAGFALDILPAEASLGPLREAVHDPHPQVRFAAVTKLGDLSEHEGAVILLEEVLQRDGDPIVRAGAAASLGQSGSQRAVDDLERALDDPDEAVRYAATVAFMVLLAPAGLEALDRHLARRPPLSSLQLQALLRFVRNMAEGQLLPTRVFGLALNGLRSEDANVRYLAALALGAAHQERAVEELLRAAAREDFDEAREAQERAVASSLGGDADALLGRLERALDEGQPAAAGAALRALSHLTPAPSQLVVSFLRLLGLRPRLHDAGLLPQEREAYLRFLAHAPETLMDCLSWSIDPAVHLAGARAIAELGRRGVRGFGDRAPLRALVDGLDEELATEALGALAALGEVDYLHTLVHIALEEDEPSGGEAGAVGAARRAVRVLTSGRAPAPWEGGHA